MKTKITVKLPVADRLGFILKWGMEPEDDQEKMILAIKQRLVNAIRACRCERAYSTAGRYRLSFRINLLGEKALVQIGALSDKQKGGIRILVNPSKWLDGDAALLNRTMRRLIGEAEYDRLMRKPLINVLDFAVDVEGADINNMLIQYKNGQQHTVFGKHMSTGAKIETLNFGSARSDYIAAAYDKRQERVHRAILELAKHRNGTDKLKTNLIKQFYGVRDQPEMMRVEIRGKKMRGKSLPEITELTNRFERFRFADLASAKGSALPPHVATWFIAVCRQHDVKTALATFKGRPEARAVHKFWRSRQVRWWKPEPMWRQGCDALRALGLFPIEAFDDDELPVQRKGLAAPS